MKNLIFNIIITLGVITSIALTTITSITLIEVNQAIELIQRHNNATTLREAEVTITELTQMIE